MDSAGRGLVRELGQAAMIRRQVVAPSSSPASASSLARTEPFLQCIVAIALEHELRRAPNVDLRDQSWKLMKSPPGPPMTLGNAAAAHVRLIVWCKACGHQVEPDPAEMVARYGADSRFSIGAIGSYAQAVGVAISTW